MSIPIFTPAAAEPAQSFDSALDWLIGYSIRYDDGNVVDAKVLDEFGGKLYVRTSKGECGTVDAGTGQGHWGYRSSTQLIAREPESFPVYGVRLLIDSGDWAEGDFHIEDQKEFAAKVRAFIGSIAKERVKT